MNDLGKAEVVQFAENAFESVWWSHATKDHYIAELKAYFGLRQGISLAEAPFTGITRMHHIAWEPEQTGLSHDLGKENL